MEQGGREQWGSRFGFIMAAAGSAVGLGNIWRFPFLAGENGGGAFLILYLACVVLVGFSIMLAEFTVGRRTQLAAVGAYKSSSRSWSFAGVLGVVSGFFIMGFYPVVGGWSIAYIFKSVSGLIGQDTGAIADAFGAFIGHSTLPLVWMLVFLIINTLIVARGVAAGIETAGKILMPILLALLAVVAIKGLTIPGSSAGLAFLFVPDWSAVTGSTVLAALGQAFFSLSLGMGCMITYGSYLNKKENLPENALMVVSIDSGIAIFAGIAMFPALFAFGMEPTQGPGLVFVVVPQIFAQMGGIGPVLAAAFFIALFIAALTSSVSLQEVVVAYLMDERKVERKKAAIGSGVVMAIMCTFSSLSLGAMSGITVFGVGAFDFFDLLTDKIFLALGGMLLAIFVGWFLKKEDLKDELTNGGTREFKLFEVWYALIKYVIPVIIAVIAIVGIVSTPQRLLMIVGVAFIVVIGIFSKKL